MCTEFGNGSLKAVLEMCSFQPTRYVNSQVFEKRSSEIVSDSRPVHIWYPSLCYHSGAVRGARKVS